MQAQKILKDVQTSYSKIAKEFNVTRNRPWSEFDSLVKHMNFKKEQRLLDLGCGNGRLLDFFKDQPVDRVDYIGLDNNKKLLSLAKKSHPKAEFKHGDILKLPFPASSFDIVWCIAVLHHIPTEKLQLKACKEVLRVLKSKGKLMLTVWNLWQPKYKKYIDKKTGDAFIPWGTSKKVKRYYHAFTDRELKNLLKKSGFATIKKLSSKYNLAYICS